MPTILCFRHTYYLVPDSVNVNVLLKSLSLLKEVEHNWETDGRGRHQDLFIRDEDRKFQLSVQIVEAKQVRGPKKPKALPEKAGPDANGDMRV